MSQQCPPVLPSATTRAIPGATSVQCSATLCYHLLGSSAIPPGSHRQSPIVAGQLTTAYEASAAFLVVKILRDTFLSQQLYCKVTFSGFLLLSYPLPLGGRHTSSPVKRKS